MKATIRDPAILQALAPLEVAAYLRSNGWKQADRLGDKGFVWMLSRKTGDEYEILLPLRKDLRDYVYRMADALRVLEVVEERSQLEIFQDLTTIGADVFRFRSLQPDAQDGTIPIDDGVELIRHARESMLAAACSAVDPRPYYPTRKPTQAVEYLQRVRLGQTERGSYVVTLVSPVPPDLAPDKNGQAPLDIEDPFERRANMVLARAFAAIRDAAPEALASGEFAAFERAVSQGVSANLCDAVAAMVGGGGDGRDLEVTITWSRLRPVEDEIPRRIQLSADAIPIIGEAGRIFRETSPRETFELVGVVVGLRRDEGASIGKVTVAGVIDGALRKIQLEMGEPDYSQAVEAHKQQSVVSCEGELVRDGRSFSLRNPRSFRVEPDA
jgi:hypothetical protein